jgi:hypothetical protein
MEGQPVWVAAEQDMAKALGQALALQLANDAQCVCIDGFKLAEGDYLDVGAPVGPAIPVVIKTLIFGDPVAGFPTLASLILLLSGIQLLCIGIVGQYLAKTYEEIKGRPVYLVRDTLDNKKED